MMKFVLVLVLAFIFVADISSNVQPFFATNKDIGAVLQRATTNTTLVPYGVIQGYASTNVPAYSNGNDSYISEEYTYLYGIRTGMKWQCVEYARRWLFIRKGCVFDSVDAAVDMWTQLKTIQRVVDGKCFNLKTYANGSTSPPKNESLLIYQRSQPDMPYGHVSVIVDVTSTYIRVAEENYHFYYWTGNYSRQIPYSVVNGSYYLQDTYTILGWMSVEDNNETKPLDQNTVDAIIKLNRSSPDFICPNHAIYHSSSFFSTLLLIVFHMCLCLIF